MELKRALNGGSIRAVFVSALLAMTVSCVARPSIEQSRLIVVDMPHGGRRIAVEPDGSGTYAYGALPAQGRFGVATFDFRDVFEKLQSVAQSNRKESGEEYGTVQFLTEQQSESVLYFVYDRELVTHLLATAFDNRVEPESAEATENLRTLNEIWLAEEFVAP